MKRGMEMVERERGCCILCISNIFLGLFFRLPFSFDLVSFWVVSEIIFVLGS